MLFDKNTLDYRTFGISKDVIQPELDFINLQIIAKVHRTIFTKNNDFQFVREMIKKFRKFGNLNRSR